jgi:hypothetical protein
MRLEVTIPQNVRPGESFQIRGPDGNMFVVHCPPDAAPGMLIQVDVPDPAPVMGTAVNYPLAQPAAPTAVNPAAQPLLATQQPVALVPVPQVVVNMNAADHTSVMDQVTPLFAWCCGYCALTPSLASMCSSTCCCIQCMNGCCREASEGCVFGECKLLCTCTGCTLCMLAGGCCCFQGACAFPCQKDIPCRLTVLCCTLGPECGACKTVNHAAVVTGIGRGRSGAPETDTMVR